MISTRDKIDASANAKPRTTTINGPYATSVQREDSPYDVAPFSCKGTYLVRTSVGISSNAILKVTSLVDKGASPNLANKDFSLPAWGNWITVIQSPPFRITDCKDVLVEGTVPRFVPMGDLCVRA